MFWSKFVLFFSKPFIITLRCCRYQSWCHFDWQDSSLTLFYRWKILAHTKYQWLMFYGLFVMTLTFSWTPWIFSYMSHLSTGRWDFCVPILSYSSGSGANWHCIPEIRAHMIYAPLIKIHPVILPLSKTLSYIRQ